MVVVVTITSNIHQVHTKWNMLLPASCVFISSSSPSFHGIVRQLSVYEWVVRKYETKGTGQVCSCTCQEDTQEKRSYSSTHAMCQKRYTGHDRGSRHGHYHAKRHQERRTLQKNLFRPQHVGSCSITLRGMSWSFNNHQTVAVYQT